MRWSRYSAGLTLVSLVAGFALFSTGCGKESKTHVSTEKPAAERWVLGGTAVGRTTGNETGNLIMADVIHLEDGTYRMYYAHAPEVGTLKSIKYAESPDGTIWTVKGTVLDGAADPADREYDVAGPRVVRLPDGRYRMYYQSSPRPKPGEPPGLHVRSAISNDGVTFTKEGVRIEISPYDTTKCLKLAGHGAFFISADGTYIGIFSGDFETESGPSDLKMLTSTDGLAFGDVKTLYRDWHDPVVIKVKGGYRLYATYLLDKFGTAFSENGVDWPRQMTDVTLIDSGGGILTEQNSGVGDIGAALLSTGRIRLYANFGRPPGDIVYFEKE